jgi:transposase
LIDSPVGDSRADSKQLDGRVHALWLLSQGYDIEETAEILSFTTRWVRSLIRHYNEGGPERLGDQRVHNGTEPSILTSAALEALKQRLRAPPDDGGQWTGPKIARWLAKFHKLKSVHDQRGWDALVAVGYSIQQPRSRHPQAASTEERAQLKKSFKPQSPASDASVPAPKSRSGQRTSIASA